MQEIIISILSFITKCLQSLVSVLKVLFQSKFNLPKYTLKGKDFILLGNGPSLEKDIQLHFELFKTSNLVVVNNFCQSPYFAQLQPKYYFLLDPVYFSEIENFNVLEDSKKAFFNDIDWEIEFHIPYSAQSSSLVKGLKQNPKISFVYYNFVSIKGGLESINHFLYNRTLAIPQSQNILVFSIFNLALCDARNVFIFGAENDWHVQVKVDKENYLYMRDEHFYEESEEQINQRLFKDLESTIKSKMSDLLLSSYKVFIGYENVQNYALTKKCKIYNCSKNSLLDSFERMDDETFIQFHK
jgi:hypothetical protein